MVHSTSIKYRVPIICFLAITIFSVALLGYTLYITLGTKWALLSLSVSLSPVRIDENTSTAYFPLVITNPSNMRIALFYLKADVKFNNTPIGTRELSWQGHLLDLPINVKTDVTVTIPVDNQTSYSNGTWSLKLWLIVDTWLPTESSISRVVS